MIKERIKNMNEYLEVIKGYSDEEELRNLEKWVSDYIVPLEKDKITWLNLRGQELREFLKKNYVDKQLINNREVAYNVGWDKTFLRNVLGMRFMAFVNIIDNFNYLIGVIPNKINKQTIVSCLCYNKDHKLLNKEETVNLIQYVETNAFYKKQGLFNLLTTLFASYMDYDKELVITDEWLEGIDCGTFERLKQAMLNNGFEREIMIKSEAEKKNKQLIK